MNLSEYKRRYAGQNSTAPGWDAIDERLKLLYPKQEPRHWGTIIKHMLGGPDPIDGISMYHSTDGDVEHLHFITYGYTALYYDESAFGEKFSGFGFEMTFRLAATSLATPEKPYWVLNLLQNLARYVFETGNGFGPYHWIPANGPICSDGNTEIVGLIFIQDPQLAPFTSPHGSVEFLQAFGITQTELDDLKTTKQTPQAIMHKHRKVTPLLVTDLSRRD
jgi:hypothetical protein